MRSQSFRAALAGLLLVLALPAGLAAQGATGRIEGRVVGAQGGAPLGGARVVVQGTQAAAVTGADGRFSLARVPVGSHAIVASLLGYDAATVAGVQVQAAEIARLEIRLATQAVALEGLTVTASGGRRGSVSRALEQQRAAVGVVNTVGTEQIARSPDSDAAQVVQRVSGVTVQDGRYVYVRGLGERYSTTSLNGARLPSPEPDRKVVPLDLFPAGILEGITVAKTFTPDLPGDFSGAQVNLKTRSFPTRRTATFSFSGGVNDAATFRDVLAAPTAGMEWLGFAGSARSLPGAVDGASLNDFGQISQALHSFRNVWTADQASGRPSTSMSASFGGQDRVLGRPLGYIASLSYSATQEVRRDEERALATLAGSAGETQPYNPFTGTTGRSSVLWGGVLNLSTQVGEGSRISLNNTYDRTSDNEALRLTGDFEELGVPLDVTRLSFVERSIYSSQLQGSHLLGESRKLDWSATLSGVDRDEPDRSDLAYAREIDPASGQPRALSWLGSRPRSATRSFSELSEQARTVEAGYTLQFGDAAVPAALKVGGLFRNVSRESDTQAFDFLNRGLSAEQLALPAEEIFGGQFYDPADPKVTLRVNQNGGRYGAGEDLGAGYAMVDYPLSDRLRVVAGARVEWDRIHVDATSVTGERRPATLENTDVLPALALNWDPTDAMRVRLSATQTLSRPEYRELSEITYFEQLGGQLVFGNPGLQRALVRNYDLRWELYPSGDELLSVALFAKDFDHPLERILVQSTGASAISFVNAEGAFNYGVEVEARKGLGTFAPFLEPVALFTNLSLIRSEITVGNETLASLTNNERPMAGQAPYVVNAGLTYSDDERGTTTVLYNVVGRKITEVGTGGLPDVYEQARHVLDFSFQLPVLGGGTTLKLDAKNLLDAPYELRQGSVVRHRYTSGRTFSLGVALRR